MKYLSKTRLYQPTLTIRRRKAISNVVTGTLELTETVIELTLPSFWQGLKTVYRRAGEVILDTFGSLIVPKVYAV